MTRRCSIPWRRIGQSAALALGLTPTALWGQTPFTPPVADVEEVAEEGSIALVAAEEDVFQPVAFEAFQPGEGMEGAAPAAPPQQRTPPRRTGPTGSRQANILLARVPNMFGDFFLLSAQVDVNDLGSGGLFTNSGGFIIPEAGGSRRVKIGENNKALPDDRVYFMYNHFHNALELNDTPIVPAGPTIYRQAHVDRYTIGAEKMFLDDLWSVEVRMPFVGSFDLQSDVFGVDGGNVGNLAIILKNLLYVDDTTAVAAGVGFDTPTGSDIEGRLGDFRLSFQNDAFHILPWIGVVHTAGDDWFVNAFVQVDIATGGNEVYDVTRQNSLGLFNEQNLLYADLSVGRYLYNNPSAVRLTSIAVLGEVHYTTTVQDSDEIIVDFDGAPGRISNPFNRQDIVNGTIAVQMEIANTTNFRFAGVFPFGDGFDERFYDAELQFQLNRRF